MKAIWTGAIGFGLVYIPVKLYSAIQTSSLDLDMLDQKDHSRILYKRVNAETGKEVAWENIVKGYALKDHYVVLDDQDFEDALPEKNKTITLQSFANAGEIDSIYFNTPYYLAPQKGGEKAYSLLHDALKKTSTVGLGSFVMRTAENLAIVRPYQNLLLLNTLHFEEELRKTDELTIPAGRVTKPEMDMAVQLIQQHQHPFSIAGFKNEYSQALLKIIQQKSKGKRVSKTRAKVENTKASQLLSQLRASLQ